MGQTVHYKFKNYETMQFLLKKEDFIQASHITEILIMCRKFEISLYHNYKQCCNFSEV